METLHLMPTGGAEIVKRTKYGYRVKFPNGIVISLPHEQIDNAIRDEQERLRQQEKVGRDEA